MKQAADYAEQNHLTLSEEGYYDLGVSAFRGKNTQEGSELHALLAAIKAGKIPAGSILLVENLDRISRNYVLQAFEIFLGIINAGVIVVSLMDKMVYDRDALRENSSPLNYSLMVLQRGHDESKTKSIRVTGAWIAAQQNAAVKKIRQSYPAWLELKDNKFKILPQQAEVVRSIFKQYLSGKGT